MVRGPRERLVDSAIALMRRKGVAGTGIAELLEHSNTARRSIYMHFPGGKDELLTESTRAAGAAMTALIRDVTATDDPRESVAAFIDMWKGILVDSDYAAACPVVAAALGGSDAPSAPAAAAASFRDWDAAIAEQLVRVGIAAPVADSLATVTVCAIEGAVIVALCSRTVQPLDRVAVHLTELVSAAAPRLSRR